MNNSTHSFHENYNPEKAALRKLLRNLNEVERIHTPSTITVQNVLSYSKALEIRPLKKLGFFENILN